MTIIYIDDKAVPLIDGGGGGCFSGDTLISTSTGTSLISDIEVGDDVWAFDDIGNLVLSKVTETFYHPNDLIYRVTHETGYLDITLNHWVLKEDGTYQELKDFKIGDNLLTDNNYLSKIISIDFLREDEVYNFKVSHFHSYIANSVKVHNGGGGGKGGGSGKEDPNSLFSTDILFITLGMGEGPVYRINPNGPQDIEFNEGNIDDLLNTDGSLNTEKFFTISNTGTITQQKLPLFGDFTFIPQRLQGAIDLKKGNLIDDGIPPSSIIKQSTSPIALTAVKFYFIIQGLQQQNDKGDILADSISVKATLYDSLGTEVLTTAERKIEGKTNTAYSFDLFVSVPVAKYSDAGYKFTIEKTSDDSASSKRQNNVTFQGWTEIIEQPIAYTRTATIGFGLKAFSEHKGGLPAMTNMIKGLIVKVPSNYNQPILENGDIDWRQVEVSDSDRVSYKYYLQKTGSTLQEDTNPTIYDGLWDGQFVYSWTQNPAWIIYDMLTNTTYGLGIPEDNIDKYSFYDVAVYCDACDVTTGKFYGVDAQADGTYRYKPRTTKTKVSEVLIGLGSDPNDITDIKERRFILDTVVSDQKQVMDIINNLTLTFRGILFYTGGKISLYQDKPDNMPVAVFNETNIISGTLNISGVGEESLLTGVDITYNDMNNHYRREVIRVDDPKALTERNYIENIAKVDLVGVSRKSQALRLAQYLLADTKYSRRKIGFKTGIEASEIAPGSIISVSQKASSVSWGYGGIVSNNSVDSSQWIYLEHLGSPPITSSFFTANTRPLVLRIASSKSGLIDTYMLSNTQYVLSNTANVTSGAEVIGVKTIKKYNHPTKDFTSFTGSWGANHLPNRHDVWTLGQINDPTNIYSSLSDKLFKVINIKRDKDETVFIEGKEYISNVYVDSDTIITYNPLRYSDLFSPLLPPPNPDFTLSAIPKRDLDGSIYTDIEISSFTDRTGYSNELVTEFYHAKPNPLSSYNIISNTTPKTDRNIVTLKLGDVSQITDGESAVLFGKNGFTTALGMTKLLVTSVQNINVDPVYKPQGDIKITLPGFAGIIDKNFGPNIHVLDVVNTFSFGGAAKLKGTNHISIPINQRDESTGDYGFVGYNSRLTNYSANVLSFDKSTNTIVIENNFSSGGRTLLSAVPNPPFYVDIPQIIDPRYFANNTLYITGGYTEIIRTNVITTQNYAGGIFKQPIGVPIRDAGFVTVYLDGNTHSQFTLEKGLDNLANSQVVVNLLTTPKEYSNIDITVVANTYTIPAIEVGDNIAWGVGNTYGISQTSYDIASPSYNSYLTSHGIYKIILSDNIKSNISVGYAVNITPDPIGVLGNIDLGTNTCTFEYPSNLYNGLLNLGNNAIYRLNSPALTFEPLGKGDSSIRAIRRAEKGIHTIKARTVNKYGRRSPFVSKSVTVRDIPIRAVTGLKVTEELYRDSTIGVAVRAIISFEAITNQDVTDYEVSYKITGTNEGDLTSYNTVKISATGIDSITDQVPGGIIRFKVDNIEKGLNSNPNKITVRVVPLNRSIRGSTAAIEQEIKGKILAPSNVINFAAGQAADTLVLIWQYNINPSTGDNIDIDLMEVHIRRVAGAIDTTPSNLNDKWSRAAEVAKVDARTNKVVLGIDQYGQYTYLVRTKDTSGIFSESTVAAIFTTIPQNFTNIYRAYSEDDPSGTYVTGITNANYGETAYVSFYESNNYGFYNAYDVGIPGSFNASIVDNANGTSTGLSVIGGSPSDLRALSSAIYQTSIRDIGNVLSGSIQIEISGDQALKSTWLDYASTIGSTQVTEATTSGRLRDVDFSGALGIGNILGFSNASAATVSYNRENGTLGSGDQSGFPANVYAIIATGNYDGDIANANVLCLIAGVVNSTAVVLGSSWYANGISTGSNGFSNLTVAGTSYKLVNLRQWLDLSDSATFYGTAGTITTNTEFRYATTSPYYANGLVNNSAFTSIANSDGFSNFVQGVRTFRYFQFKYIINNFDPQQAEFLLDKFRYKVAISERSTTQSVTVDSKIKAVDYSSMGYTQVPKIVGSPSVTASSNQEALPQCVIIDRGVQGANISVYFSNGLSAHNIGTSPTVDITVTGV